MAIDVLLGLQWGDEGKGKMIDVLMEKKYGIAARFQGGPNAGHTIENPLGKFVLHQLPSGVFHPSSKNILGAGMVIDIGRLIEEIHMVESAGIDLQGRLCIAREAHIILPTHIAIDEHMEKHAEQKIGSTKRGIGPTYGDKVNRKGMRIGDLFYADYFQKAQVLGKDHLLRFSVPQQKKIKASFDTWLEDVATLRQMKDQGLIQIVDSIDFFQQELAKGTQILAEGAQGALLDINFGTYPFVTSSSTVTGGVCTGLGVPPQAIGKTIGVTKAYCTRVGEGPFPTELFDETGALLQQLGNEKGATTGRIRRCGWLDVPLLAYAIKLTGTTELVVTKLDILEQLPYYKMCIGYERNGILLKHIPYALEDIDPVYATFDAGTNFVDALEDKLLRAGCHQVKLKYVSTGPKREALTVYM